MIGNKNITKHEVLPIIIARMDSRRMPEKVLMSILDGHSVIERIVEQVWRLRQGVSVVSEPVIATTTRLEDKPIVQLGESLGVEVFTGTVSPLLRMSLIAERRPESWLWRLNADSPLILIPLIQHAIEMLPKLDQSNVVVTNLIPRTFPYGVSLELYRTNWLKQVANSSLTENEKEHITPLHKKIPESSIFRIVASELTMPDFDSTVRLTIDYEEDARFFHSLWQLQEFKKTEAGSLKRVNLAYEKKKKVKL